MYSLYWNPVGTNTKPWFSNFKVESDPPGAWEAKVTLGLAPRQSEGEWEQFGDKPPIRGHPYFSSIRAAGFDIERKGIVLQTAFWAEEKGSEGAFIIKERSNVFTHVRGKIILTSGFRSREEKTGVLVDRAWIECTTAIREILQGKVADLQAKDCYVSELVGLGVSQLQATGRARRGSIGRPLSEGFIKRRLSSKL